MPMYLGRFKYSADAIKAMIENPQDRGAAAARAAESLGCKLEGLWWSLGERDGVFLLEAPDNVSAASLSMLVGGSGALSRLETTPLLTMEEAQEALSKAAAASYRPPAG